MNVLTCSELGSIPSFHALARRTVVVLMCRGAPVYWTEESVGEWKRRSKSAAGGGPIVQHPTAVNAFTFCGSSKALTVRSVN